MQRRPRKTPDHYTRLADKPETPRFIPHFTFLVETGLRQELDGKLIHFDAIAVVNSAQSIAIEDWKIVHTLSLG